jgi:hypothetical protein
MPGGPCCWLDLCCPPDQAAAALAEHLGITAEAAAAVLKGFRLVPRDVPKVLLDHLDARLRAYLEERGHPTA